MPKTRRRRGMALDRVQHDGQRTVLVVEDSATQAESLLAILEGGGFGATLARNGEDALRLLRERGFDLVISDIVMPGEVDGYELSRQIKAGPHRETPVVLLTSLSDPMDIIRGLEAGADNFLTKPCEPEHLLERLEVLLATRRARTRGRVRAGVTVYFMDRQFTITSEREQILDLLVSTFEDAVRQNRELLERESALGRSQKTLAALYEIAVALNGCTTEAEVAATALDKAMVLPGVRAGWLSLREGDKGLRLVAARNLPPALQAPGAMEGDCYCRRQLLAGDLDQVTNVLECERLQRARGETYGLRYHASVPLWIQNRTVGVLNLVGVDRGLFSEDDRTILDAVGNQIATALERARLREQLELLVDQRTVALRAEMVERGRAEEALRERERQLSSIYDTTADVLFYLALEKDGRYRFASVNQAFCSVTGLRYDQVVGKLVNEVVPEPSLTVVLDKYAEAIREKRVVRWEETSEYPTGKLTGEVSVAPVFDDAGNCTHLVGAVHNITERKRAEEALRASEERFRQLAEHIKEAFLLMALPTGKALYVSPTWEEIWGRPLADAYADPELWFRTIHPDDQGRVGAGRAVVARGEPVTNLFRVLRPDGSTRWVRGRMFPVRDASGRVYRLVGVADDVTELKRVEEQVAQAQKMEAVGRLAGGVAHDFNNLLTVILGEVDLLRGSLDPAHPGAESLHEIRKAGERASVLTRQLLAFSRRQLVEPTVFKLNDAVAEMDKMLRRLLGEDIQVTARLATDAGAVQADRGQIEQVLANLAVNARDAMPRGGSLTLETQNVRVEEDSAHAHAGVAPGEYVLLQVSDTGTGMTDEVKARVFEPFFTTKEPGRGTGLGLATSYGIVKQTGGHIAIYSELEIGTTVKVYLPRVETEAAPETPPEAGELPQGGETILLVEDETPVSRVAARVLEMQGYRVLVARDGSEALQLLEKHQAKVDLLLTDVVLPRSGGRELAEQVRALRPGIKVLFTSGYTSDVILQRRLLEHDVALLQKPFTRESLARKVREVLDG